MKTENQSTPSETIDAIIERSGNTIPPELIEELIQHSICLMWAVHAVIHDDHARYTDKITQWKTAFEGADKTIISLRKYLGDGDLPSKSAPSMPPEEVQVEWNLALIKMREIVERYPECPLLAFADDPLDEIPAFE
jgi:hypothetical protein